MAQTSFVKLGYIDENNQFVPTNLRAQDLIASDGTSVEAHITNAAVHLDAEKLAKLNGAVQSDKLGAANGAATLDASGKLTTSQIPDQLLGKVAYKGTFDPTTGLDADGNALPAPAKANLGWYWIASTDGTYTMPGNTVATDFTTGDWAISNGTSYSEVDNSTADPVARASAAAAQTTATEANTTAQAAQTTADAASTAAATAQTAAEAASAAAAKLSVAHVSSEEELASLNLRPGALVLMDVTNSASEN